MALYDITDKNGVTKVETQGGYVYHFPLEVIRTDTADASMTRTPTGESDSEYVRFVNIPDKLGASTIEGYVDQLAIRGNYFSNDKSTASLAAQGRVDSFGRWRVSAQQSVIDLKQVYDNLPLFFDEETGGTGASAYNSGDASSTLSVSANTDYVVRQTKQRFNYQTGKSQLIECTFVGMQAQTDVTKRIGYFSSNAVAPFDSDKDGLWLETSGGAAKVVMSKTGTATTAEQSSWNIDPMDGNGPSGITLDLSKAHILVIDFQWLGTGRVRFGFSINGGIYYVHEFLNANNITSVYMSNPSQAIRYEVRSTGGAGSLDQICSTVQSEGGQDPLGVIRSVSTAEDLQCSSAGTVYAVYGIRLKSGRFDDVNLLDFSILNENNDDFIYRLLLNPTVTGTFTYADLTNSAMQVAVSENPTIATASGGTELAAGAQLADSPASKQLDTALKLGTLLDGTKDEIVLTVEPLTAGADIFASISWRELI